MVILATLVDMWIFFAMVYLILLKRISHLRNHLLIIKIIDESKHFLVHTPFAPRNVITAVLVPWSVIEIEWTNTKKTWVIYLSSVVCAQRVFGITSYYKQYQVFSLGHPRRKIRNMLLIFIWVSLVYTSPKKFQWAFYKH